MLRWIIFITIYLLVDAYAYQAFRTLSKSRVVFVIYWLISVLILANLIYQLSIGFDRSVGLTQSTNQAIGLFLAIFIPKIAILFFVFGEDIIRTPMAAFRMIFGNKTVDGAYFPSRRKFVSQLALLAAALPISSLLYGMYNGKYNYKVLKYTLESDDLPTAFD